MTLRLDAVLAIGVLACATSSATARAQSDNPALLSLVAGYKATFTCSAHFNAGRSVEQIDGDELNRIYPGYREALAALPDAVVDEDKKAVAVSYKEGYPPRIARWRPYLGCTQLPSWAGLDGVDVDLPEARLRMTRDLPKPLPESTSSDPGLVAVIDAAFDQKTYGQGTETTAALVLQDGAIIAEQYRDGFDKNTPQRTWSVAKSIAATVIGAAIKDGHIGLDERTGLAQWSVFGDPRRRITFRDLLHMSSGLDATPAGNRTDDIYFGGGRVIDHATTRRLISEPGKRWYYANNDTMIMMRALRERIGDDQAYLNYPFERVLHPLGMRHTFLETDWFGDFVMSSQVWTTARDLARLGLLYLNAGEWNGEQLLPEDWAEFVATAAADQPPPRANGDPRPGYGAQFWLFDENWGLPNGTYAAMGNRGQYLVIIPERNMLVVRRGFDDNGGARFDIAKFASDVVAALPE